MMRQNTKNNLGFYRQLSLILVLFILPHHSHLPPHLPYILILFPEPAARVLRQAKQKAPR
jgi:hypothetical protein